MVDYIEQFLQHAQARGSKSTAVTPAGWILTAALSAVVIAIKLGAEQFIIVALIAVVGIAAINFIACYWYFALTDPDALRSERFSLTKLAIEHSAKGDNVTGIVDAIDLPKLPPKSEAEEE